MNKTEMLARQLRRDAVRMIANAGSGHVGGALGAAEIFAVLYEEVLQLGDDYPKSKTVDNDRFILSNGHICAAWYAVLAHRGFLPTEELATHRKMGSRLQGHPSRAMWPEVVEHSSGPLGQGLSVANGLAMAIRMNGGSGRVFCLVGDGEMSEGQIWEAVHSAGHHKLNNLVLIIASNDIQIDGFVHDVKALEPLAPKLEAFGWDVSDVDGHDTAALRRAFARQNADSAGSAGSSGPPHAVIARTTLGRGVSFMENRAAWHGTPISSEQAAAALAELGPSDGFSDFPIQGGGL